MCTERKATLLARRASSASQHDHQVRNGTGHPAHPAALDPKRVHEYVRETCRNSETSLQDLTNIERKAVKLGS